MNQTKKRKKCSAKTRIKHDKPAKETAVPISAPEPAGPPLTGAELELTIAEVMCRKFRDTPERKAMRKESKNADNSAIEAAIVSPGVRAIVEPVACAYALEQAIAVLHLLFFCARALLESEKTSAGQGTALKTIIEVIVEKLLQRIVGDLLAEPSAALFSSAFEQSVVENMLQLLRGQRAPAAHTPQQTVENAGANASASNGNSLLHAEPGG